MEHEIFMEVVWNDGSVHRLQLTSDICTAYNNSYLYYYQCVLAGAIKVARMIVDGETYKEFSGE